MTKFDGLVECPNCNKMTRVKSKTVIKYIRATCDNCNKSFLHVVKTLGDFV